MEQNNFQNACEKGESNGFPAHSQQQTVSQKTFAHMLVNRMENTLETAQPEEQHRFQPGRRTEEHFLSANLRVDTPLMVQTALWIVGLGLSKGLGKVSWPALWRALCQQGISDHLIWLLVFLHTHQGRQGVGEINNVQGRRLLNSQDEKHPTGSRLTSN